ncbi:ABC transporter ATP-binding protein [Bacteroides acidifaciens]|uniref:ABC transporter ATP-binding protein n=1 Tax=Bacteroides acidifaciens TaxID=85831 RepID=UPI002626E25C|nr:ABC transporter ATP-binding protein [Bacteroides acidifaciens]
MITSGLTYLWQYSNGFRLRILVAIILSCIGVMFSLLFVETTKQLLDDISNEIVFSFASAILYLIGFKGGQIICEQSEIYLRSNNRVRLENCLEYNLFCKLTNSSVYSATNLHSGDSIYRLSSDVGIVAEGVSYTLPMLFYSVVQLLATWVYLMTMQPGLTVLLVLIGPTIIFATYYYTRILSPVSKTVRKHGSEVNQYLQEHIQHKELIAILEQHKFVQESAKTIQNRFITSLLKKIKITVGADSITEVGFAISYLSIFIWGIYSIPNGLMTYGTFVVFLQLVGQLQRPVFLFKDQYPSFISALASTERIQEIFNLYDDQSKSKKILKGELGVCLENVSFTYPNNHKQVLEQFSWDFKPCSITAIMGETGVGKSTLVKLLLGLMTPDNGSIKIYSTEQDENELVSRNTRCNFIYVPQGNNIISGSIRYNLQLGNPNASEEEMRHALWVAAGEFVYNQLPEGLDTIIGERGFSLSEGQSQRISIARGLLKSGSIIILDEPTSSLDKETEKTFFERLFITCKGKTIIIITHRDNDTSYFHNILTLKPIRNNK